MELFYNRKYSAKRSGFSRFYLYLAMSDEVLFDFICNTKLNESSDMAKYWVIYYSAL